MLIKIEIELNVTKEDIEEIIEMAGYGIAYWADEAIVKDDGYVIHEEEDDKWHELGYEDILKGIELYIKNGNVPYGILSQDIISEKMIINTGNVDSDVADMIIQYACFGEIEYC